MEDITEILNTMQKGFIDVLIDIELALINKQYDIAHNILRQAKKDIQGDLNEKEELVIDGKSIN